jgi:ABC-2 type transport system ATP-binding protein
MVESEPSTPVADEPAILIEHARKDYGKAAGGRREAVSDVSLAVSRGAIHGLLGPNGAGKTTTLKMLLGLVRPSGGRFEILGVPAARAGAKAPLGFLPEQPYFPPQLTAWEALRLYGQLSGMGTKQIAAEAEPLLERVGLAGKQKTLLSRFSRGMLQRLGLAQALLGSPSVVVLDEPASGLDPVGQRDVRNLMLELRDTGTSILLSSHQLSEVEAVCDEVTILHRGLVAARGHIDDLLNIAGQTSVRARGEGDLPAAVHALVTDEAYSGAMAAFSVGDENVRRVVDAIDDAGWQIVSVTPKRDSLEDYFARLLAETSEPTDSGKPSTAKRARFDAEEVA